MKDIIEILTELTADGTPKKPISPVEAKLEPNVPVSVTLTDANGYNFVMSAAHGEKHESFTTCAGDALRIRVTESMMALVGGRYLKGSDTLVLESDVSIKFLPRFTLTSGDTVTFYAKQRYGIVPAEMAMPGSPVFVVTQGKLTFPQYIEDYNPEPVYAQEDMCIYKFKMPAQNVLSADFE